MTYGWAPTFRPKFPIGTWVWKPHYSTRAGIVVDIEPGITTVAMISRDGQSRIEARWPTCGVALAPKRLIPPP
jgi:hypothetical protein